MRCPVTPIGEPPCFAALANFLQLPFAKHLDLAALSTCSGLHARPNKKTFADLHILSSAGVCY